jgi:peptidoglycan/LPS O-acetylase OafA/YrhL
LSSTLSAEIKILQAFGSSSFFSVLDKSPRIHIGFIDAFRALAALYVVIYHTFSELEPYKSSLQMAYPTGVKCFDLFHLIFFRYGHFAVAVFIVISGFCLMLPLARKDKMRLDGTGQFIARRAWRILPPYYAALVISLLFMIIVPGLNRVMTGEWSYAIPAFEPWDIISHLFLFHHWSDL